MCKTGQWPCRRWYCCCCCCCYISPFFRSFVVPPLKLISVLWEITYTLGPYCCACGSTAVNEENRPTEQPNEKEIEIIEQKKPTHTHTNANTKCLSTHFSTDELYKINVHLKIKVSKTEREKKWKRKKHTHIYIQCIGIAVITHCGTKNGRLGMGGGGEWSNVNGGGTEKTT